MSNVRVLRSRKIIDPEASKESKKHHNNTSTDTNAKAKEESNGSPECKRRRLRPSSVESNSQKKIKNNKHKLNDANSLDVLTPLKRLKISISAIDTKSTQDGFSRHLPQNEPEKDSRKVHFIEACQEVSTREFYNLKSRLSLDVLPDCCIDNKTCQKNHDENQVTSFEVVSHEQEAFKINLRAGMWNEALNVCKDVLRYNKYPSVEMMISIIEIIMNAHGDAFKSQSIQMILQRCLSTFKLIFSTHPPCLKILRKKYANFLTQPYKKAKDETTSQRKCGIFHFILNKLQEELQSECDPPLLKSEEMNQHSESTMSLEEANFKRKNYENYDTLEKTDRLKRLFLALEVLIDILERDLAIWTMRFIQNPYKHINGKHKPLIAICLWELDYFHTGTINGIVCQIFKLFVDTIRMNFPNQDVTILSRLITLLANIYYLCENSTGCIYPNIGKYIEKFSIEIFKIIKNENLCQILCILDKIINKPLKFLLAQHTLKHVINSEEDDYLKVVHDIFERKLWNKYSDSKSCIPDLKHAKSGKKTSEATTKDPKYLYAKLLSKIKTKTNKGGSMETKYIDYYKNSKLKNSEQGIDKPVFMLILYFSLKNYLDLYNIENIQVQYHNKINAINKKNTKSNENQINPTENVSGVKTEDFIIYEFNNKLSRMKGRTELENIESFQHLVLNENCFKDYRSIFQKLKEITLIYKNIKDKIILDDLFKNISILQS